MYDVVTQSFLESKFVVPFTRRFAGSSHGWLVAVEKDFSVMLYKPYSPATKEMINSSSSTTTIRLPPLCPPSNPELLYSEIVDYYLSRTDYYIRKATITADPLKNPDHCIVAVIFSEELRIAFIRPGRDTAWTVADCDMKMTIDDILYYNDRFYGVDNDGTLFSFKITESFNIEVKLVASSIPYDIIGNTYLVESRGKLLMVVRYMEWFNIDEPEEGRETTDAYVYELDFDKQTWVENETLGDDVALFMGDNTSISVLASDFPGCKPNCIYFTHDTDMLRSDQHAQNDFVICDFENGRMEWNFGLDTTSLSKIGNRVLIWVVNQA